MCGITGIFNLDGEVVQKQHLERMNNKISHRGPDDDGLFIDGPVGLGHRRLSIIDLSSAGHQPMFIEDGRYSMVYNGEIYNFKEVQTKLKDYNFTSSTDSEVILAAYAKWGAECLTHLNGMFAFAIWDNEEQEMFIARDRLGIKPLYYYQSDSHFIFGSELRAILEHPSYTSSVDTDALTEYLRYTTVHAPRTILKGIKMMEAGYWAKIKGKNVDFQQYWDITKNNTEKSANKTYSEVCADVKDLFVKAVNRRMLSDVPLGAFLSGGIDSSAIVAVMAQNKDAEVKTFSITFDESKYDESPYSDLVSEKYKTNHTQIQLKAEDCLKYLPDALAAFDHPSADGVNTYIVSRVTKEAGITVALSGLGSDEIFAGYKTTFGRLHNLKKIDWLWNIPKPIRHAAGSLINNIKNSASSQKLADVLDRPNISIENTYPLVRQVWIDHQISALLGKDLEPNSEQIYLESKKNNLSSLPDLSKVSVGELRFYVQSILLRDTDQVSMVHPLEVRVPFLDHELVEYVMGVKDEYKFGSTPKKLLVDALGDLLPYEVVHRPKMGFGFPWELWMKNELKDFCASHIQNLANRSFMDSKEVHHAWESFLKGERLFNWTRLWSLIVLESWLEKNDIKN